MGSSLLHRDGFYIGGAWVAPCGEETLTVVSPSTEEAVGSVPVATHADVDRAVDAASRAFTDGPWPRMAASERAGILARAAELLAERTSDIVAVTTDEMGCAVSQAPQAQTGLVGPLFRYYSDLLGSFDFERTVVSGERAGLVTQEPVGVVAAIVPWNAPVTLAAWKAAPALAAGCTLVLKPAPEAPLSNFVLAEVLDEAGVPPGVFNVVPAGRDVGEHLVTHRGVDKVAFTGSTAAGKRIMGLCAQRLTRVSLELGGKSAALVLDDADLAAVVPRVVHGVMHLSGQVCGAQTRVLVPRRAVDEVLAIAAETASDIVVGDPHDPATEVGPLVAARQRERVEHYVALAAEAGARVVAGERARRTWPGAGTWRRRSSVTSTTPCVSPVRRSSGRCSASSLTTATTRRCASPTTPTTGWPAGCGAATSAGRSVWRGDSAPAAWRSTAASRRSRSCPSAVSRSPASVASSVPRACSTSWSRAASGCPRRSSRTERTWWAVLCRVSGPSRSRPMSSSPWRARS